MMEDLIKEIDVLENSNSSLRRSLIQLSYPQDSIIETESNQVTDKSIGLRIFSKSHVQRLKRKDTE